MPTHPVDGKTYHYKANVVNGTLEYLLYGELSSGDCFIVNNSSAFTGHCQNDTNL